MLFRAPTGADTMSYAAAGVFASGYAPSLAGVGANLAAQESGLDALAASVALHVAGALSASESGTDTGALAGYVRVTSMLAVLESGVDAGFGISQVVVSGGSAATEQGYDVLAAEGEVGSVYLLGKQEARWLYQLVLLHGLDPAHPLTVSASQRAAGPVQQGVAQQGSDVVVTTLATSNAIGIEPVESIALLARVHGLIDPLRVSDARREADTLYQTLGIDGGVTTVTRQ